MSMLLGQRGSVLLVLHLMKNSDDQRKGPNGISRDTSNVMMLEMYGERHLAIHLITSMVMEDPSRDTGIVSGITLGIDSIESVGK